VTTPRNSRPRLARLLWRALYWLAVLAVSLVLVFLLLLFLESRDDSTLDSGNASGPGRLNYAA
jgi:hypothetical protein